MLVEYITFTPAELNAAAEQFKEIPDKALAESATITVRYRPSSITVKNHSGNTVYFLLLTELEKTKYLEAEDKPTISSLLALLHTGEVTYDNFVGEIRHILVIGTGGHENEIIFEVLQDTDSL